MMLKCLHEVALAGLVVPEGADKATEREILRRRQQVEAQLSLARRAILMLKSLFADVSVMRVDGGDGFQGTGDCEFGHEGVDVTLDWPNLALLTDETKEILDEIAVSDVPKIWFVFHGDCSQSHRCEAADREEAMEICAEANPGSKIHVAVPASAHGELVMYGYGEEMVHCPRCGSRTDFGELPRDGWQVHVCLSCNHSFIAVPEDPEESEAEPARTFAWQGTWSMNQDGRIETQPRVEKTEEGFVPTLAIAYAGGEPTFETAEPRESLEEAKTAAETLDSDWHRRETDEVEAEMSVVSTPAPGVAEGVSEVIADIAFTAGHLMGTGKLVAFPDSREMMGLIMDWANQFEAVFDKDSHGDDYMELVDDYATYRLTGEHDKAEKVLVAMQVMRQVTA
jgi:hypothetical protein